MPTFIDRARYEIVYLLRFGVGLMLPRFAIFLVIRHSSYSNHADDRWMLAVLQSRYG